MRASLKAIGKMLTALGGVAPVLMLDATGLAGAGLISYGAWRVYEPAGFIVAGLLLLCGVALASRGRKA